MNLAELRKNRFLSFQQLPEISYLSCPRLKLSIDGISFDSFVLKPKNNLKE